MDQVPATRSELLALREELALARRGRDLLDEKRNQLLAELRRVAETVLAGEDELERAAGEAAARLGLAEALDGPDRVLGAAAAAGVSVRPRVRTARIMGVRVAEVSTDPLARPLARRGYGLAESSPRIDGAAAAFETEIELLIEQATRELRVRRLVTEIARTTRRVNALEHVVIPDLTSSAAHIASVLDEREREDRFRLIRIRRRR